MGTTKEKEFTDKALKAAGKMYQEFDALLLTRIGSLTTERLEKARQAMDEYDRIILDWGITKHKQAKFDRAAVDWGIEDDEPNK